MKAQYMTSHESISSPAMEVMALSVVFCSVSTLGWKQTQQAPLFPLILLLK